MAYKDKRYSENLEATFLDDALCELWQRTDQEGKEREDIHARRFLDPREFEAYLQNTCKELWPVEFRRAFAFFDYLKEANKMTWGATAALECLHDLAAYYVPEQSTTTAEPTAAQALNIEGSAEDVPPYLDSLEIFSGYRDKAAIIFRNLKTAQFLGDDWKPAAGIEKNHVVYITYQLAAILYKKRGGIKELCDAWGLKFDRVKASRRNLLADIGTRCADTLKKALEGAQLESNEVVTKIIASNYAIYENK